MRGQYKFSITFETQIGLLININKQAIKIEILFLSISIGLLKDAWGYNIFDRWQN